MQKNAFKIMGALLVLVLAVTFSVGAVSAYVIPTADTYNINIVNDSLVLTKDVPSYVETSPGVWEQLEAKGNFVSVETAYGVLRSAYGDELKDSNNALVVSALNADYANNTITSINGKTLNGYTWRVFIGNSAVSSLSSTVANGETVSFVLTSSTKSTLSKVPTASVSDSIAFTVSVAEPVVKNVILTNVPEGTTGLAALRMAAAQEGFEVSVSDDGWIVHIDNVSKNWDKTGEGWATLVNDQATNSLPYFTMSSGQTLKLWMSPAVEGGSSSLPVTGSTQWGGGYYLDGAVYRLTISIQ